MKDVIKYLEEIKEHQMNNVQFAKSTEVYKLADKALKAITVIPCCKSDSELLKIPKTTKEQRVQLNEGYNKK